MFENNGKQVLKEYGKHVVLVVDVYDEDQHGVPGRNDALPLSVAELNHQQFWLYGLDFVVIHRDLVEISHVTYRKLDQLKCSHVTCQNNM